VIAHLRGSILEKHPNRIVIDVNGVGYDVFVPLSTFYGLGDPGAAIALRIHTHVREDAFLLYGFATRLEQELFDRASNRRSSSARSSAAISPGSLRFPASARKPPSASSWS
jgi:Holliday junction DNA helicase RuvA